MLLVECDLFFSFLPFFVCFCVCVCVGGGGSLSVYFTFFICMHTCQTSHLQMSCKHSTRASTVLLSASEQNYCTLSKCMKGSKELFL